MQFHLKEIGWGAGRGKSPSPIHLNKTIFNRADWSLPLLQRCTYCSKLSLKFNTQRVP